MPDLDERKSEKAGKKGRGERKGKGRVGKGKGRIRFDWT
jgi:hypothetical protein